MNTFQHFPGTRQLVEAQRWRVPDPERRSRGTGDSRSRCPERTVSGGASSRDGVLTEKRRARRPEPQTRLVTGEAEQPTMGA